MQVGRRGLGGARKESTFALYAKQSFTILPDALVGVLVKRQVGRNGWAVMAALCHAIFSDDRIGVMSSNEVCARTGLTKYQVARGMTELRDKGIIAPVIRTNADRALIPAFDVLVYRDGVTVDLGTLTNDAPPSETPPAPGVCTEATDADDGDHEAVADDSVTIVDTVSCTGLTPGKEYALTGTLVDKETGEPARSDGKAVTSTVAFVPDAADDTQEVAFTFDGAELSGHTVMAFESLVLDGQEVASHADVNDEGQTVPPGTLDTSDTPDTPEAPTPGVKLPQTGDELPIVGICALAAAGCAATVIGIARSIGPRREEDEGEDG